MSDLGAVLAQIKAQRAKLDRAIEALSGITGEERESATAVVEDDDCRAARQRIAAAQKARWAKFKAKKSA